MMTIVITDKNSPIYLTQAEHDRIYIEYQKESMMRVDPPTFEVWLKQRQRNITSFTNRTNHD